MTLSMEKDERVNLTKESGGSELFVVGLGWADGPYDLDAFAVLCAAQPDGSAKVIGKPGFIYFQQLVSACGGIQHMGDNLTGHGEGDDEQIFIDTSKVAANIDRIDLWVSIYKAQQRGHKMGQVMDAYIRIGVGKRDASGAIVQVPGKSDALIDPVLKQYDLTEDYSTMLAVQMGALYRKAGETEWRFHAMGEGQKAEMSDIFNHYQPGIAG